MSNDPSEKRRHLQAAQRLQDYRSDLEHGAFNVATTLNLALQLIHASDWLDEEASSQYATQLNVGALLGCARLAAERIDSLMGGVWDLMDADLEANP